MSDPCQPTPNAFARHNAEVQQVWESYNAGRPVRVPCGHFNITQRIWVLDPRLNTDGITWKAMCEDPDVMFNTYLKFRYYAAHNIPYDIPMGVPETCWEVRVEFWNVAEEAWLGCPLIYPDGQVHTTVPRYTGKHKEELFERGIPGPFDGLMGKVREFHEYFLDKACDYEYCGRPVSVTPPSVLTTNGPLTLALGVCGTELLEDMITNEGYYHRVMSLITDAIIGLVRAWRAYVGVELCPEQGDFMDDDIQYLSRKSYVEKVLPYHRRLVSALWGAGPHHMHLCGNVQRHFPTLTRELNVKSFETGFPIDFSTLRDEVGNDVEIEGGVRPAELVTLTPEEIYAKTRAILASGIMRGGRFIMREANNLAPMTPIENLAAMYAAVKEHGVYSVSGPERPTTS